MVRVMLTSTYSRWMIVLFLILVSATAQMASAETAHVANHVVISEVQIATDEFVELYNPTNSDIHMTGWHWCYFSSTKTSWGDPYRDQEFPSGATIHAHGFYLVGLGGYPTPTSDWQPYTSNFLGSDKGTVGIFNGTPSDSTRIDAIGWGSVTLKERTSANAPDAGKSIERKAIASSTASDMASGGDHYTWGNGEDMNNNSADFITKTTPEPQNSSSATEDCPAQSWFLHNDSAMYKENMSKPEGTATVSDGSSTIWGANEPAAVDVGFPAGTWTGKITLSEPFASNKTFTVEVGSYEDSTFTSAGSQICTGAADKITFSLEIPATAFDISNGNYLALNITNPSDGSGDLVIKTGGGNSYVTSPSTDPGYPVPELSTIILFSAGLLILAGYAYMGRRNK